MAKKKAAIGILGIILVTYLVIVLGYAGIIWQIYELLVSSLIFSMDLFITMITLPAIYPLFYWVTYFSALIGVSIVMITLMW